MNDKSDWYQGVEKMFINSLRINRKISVFYKYFFSYIIILLLPFMILGFFLFSYAVKEFNKEIESSYSYKLEQISNDMDANFQSMESVAFRIADSKVFNPYRLKSNAYAEIEAIDELKKQKDNLMLIDECIFYFKNNNDIYTSTGKFRNDIYFNNVVIFPEWSNFIDNVNDMQIPSIKYYKDLLFTKTGAAEGITYAYPVSTSYSSNKDTAAIFMISKQTIKNRIKNLVGELYGDLIVIDSNNKSIININYSQDLPNNYYEAFLDDNSAKKQISVNGKKYMILKFNSSIMKYKYVLILPQMQYAVQVGKLKSIMSIVIALSVILSLLLGILLAYNNYKPIKKLNSLIRDRKPNMINTRTRNEVENISFVLNDTISSNVNLEIKIMEQKKWMRYELLSSLIKGNYDEHHMEYDDELNFLMNSPNYCVMVISIIQEGEKGKYILKDDILSLIEAEYSDKHVAYGIELLYKDLVAVIFSIYDNPEETRISLAKEMFNKFSCMDLTIAVGVGSISKDLRKLNNSYIEALTAFEHRKEMKDKNFILFEQVVQNYSDFNWYPSEEILRLVQNIRQGTDLSAKENLELINTQVKEKCISKIWEKYVCFNIANTLIKVFREMNFTITLSEINSLLDYDNIDELFESISILVNKVCLLVTKSLQNKENEFVANMLAFVHENFLSYDMGLEILAEKFNVSVYYLSKIFKEDTGTGFKEYIIMLRMEEAKRLLNNTEISIGDLCEKVGYSNTSHFIKTFKNHVGVTPAKFRSMKTI